MCQDCRKESKYGLLKYGRAPYEYIGKARCPSPAEPNQITKHQEYLWLVIKAILSPL